MYKITFYNSDDVLTYNAEKNLLYKNNKLLKVKNKFSEEKFMKENDNYNIRITLGRNCNLCCVYCIQNNVKRSIDDELSVDDFIFHLKHFVGKKKNKFY
jgi:sulfatase maturation enzyme AslB (radical SAM superfamily)